MNPIATATTREDVAYVSAHYVPFAQLARGLSHEADWPGTHLPCATYQTIDGTLWFARDWWRLYDDAGELREMRSLFERRLAATAARLGHLCDVAHEWDAYVAGLYGACLRDVTPESIALKEHLVASIERDLAAPRPEDEAWRAALRADVEVLDGLTRPFAACDRFRFGGPTSRDRLIRDVRMHYPQAFQNNHAPDRAGHRPPG